MFDAIAFAGGGNRCYWQGGFYEAVADRLALPPKLAVGVSAGAFACIYSILGIGPRVRKRVLAACGPHRKNFGFSGWRAGGPLCPVGPMYPALLGELIDNAPVGPIEPSEAAGGRTLVLLTRRSRRVPTVPGRTYVRPSRPIGAKQFDVSTPAAIRDAYELGLKDGKAFAFGA